MIIGSGDDVVLRGRSLADQPDLAGTILEDEVFTFTDLTFTVTGEAQSRVVQTSSGTLDFYFRVRSLTYGALRDVIFGTQMTGPILTDVEYRLDGLGDIGPTRAERNDQGEDGAIGSSKRIAFTFGEPVTPGRSSRFIYMKTDHLTYNRYQSVAILGPALIPLPSGSPTWSTTLVAFAPGQQRF